MTTASRPTMNRRVLVSAYAIPGQGGASTAAYELVRAMQRDGLDAWLINIISDEDAAYYAYVLGDSLGNPAGLPHVHNCVLERAHYYPDPRHQNLADLVDTIDPDVMVGADFIPTILLGNAAPGRTLIFLTAGSEQASRYIESGRAPDLTYLLDWLVERDAPPPILHRRERQAVRLSDLVVTHADCVRELYRHFYPFDEGKIADRPVWFAEWICERARDFGNLARPFPEREIDLLLVATRWDRHEKNWGMVKKLIDRCRDLRVHVVGETGEEHGHAVYHQFLADRASLFELFGNTKVVVSTSNLDAAPGILFEASVMGCNVVASKNCGNWALFHEDLLVAPYETAVFEDRIRCGIRAKMPDNLARFLHPSSYWDLVDTLAVI